MKTLEHLLTPIRIKSLEIANRIVMPPMGTGLDQVTLFEKEAQIGGQAAWQI